MGCFISISSKTFSTTTGKILFGYQIFIISTTLTSSIVIILTYCIGKKTSRNIFINRTNAYRSIAGRTPRHTELDAQLQIYWIVQNRPDHPRSHWQKVGISGLFEYLICFPWTHWCLKEFCVLSLSCGISNKNASRWTGKNGKLTGSNTLPR